MSVVIAAYDIDSRDAADEVVQAHDLATLQRVLLFRGAKWCALYCARRHRGKLLTDWFPVTSLFAEQFAWLIRAKRDQHVLVYATTRPNNALQRTGIGGRAGSGFEP